jgi:uncharacterized membrane protein
MSGNKLFGVLVVLLLSLQFALAGELTLYKGSGPEEICPGSTGLFSDIIENSGNEDMQVSVSSSGTASVFSTTVPQGFVLAPGDIRTIFTYVTPSSSTGVGSYNLAISANSESLSHNLFVKDCFYYSLNSLESEKHICPGETESFSFEISNDGEYAETYELTIEGNYPGQVSLSEGVVSVSAGSSKLVEIYINAGEDSIGDYGFNLVSNPYAGSVVNSAEALLVVDPCYDFSIETEKDSISFCEHSQETVSIEVKNDGSTENVYDLEVEGPSWANLENNKLTIGSESSGNVNLVLTPDYGIQGSFEVKFKVTPEKGNVQALNIFNVNVKKCHDVTVDVEKGSDTICNSLESNYNVNIVNNGEYDKEYYLELNGPDWVDLDERSISLGVGEDTKVNLVVNPGYDVSPSTYTIEVSAHAKDSSKVASSDKIEVTTVTREECYKVALSVENNQIEIYSDSTATIPVIVENMGSDEATYELSVGGTASSFVYLNPSVITLGESKSELVYLYVAPAEKVSAGKYSVSVSARLGDSTILDSQTVEIIINEGAEAVEIEVTGEVVVETSSDVSPFMKFISFLKSLFTSESTVEEEVEEIDSLVEDLVGEESEELNLDLEDLVEEESEEVNENLESEEVNENLESEEVNENLESEEVSLMSLGEVMNFNIGEEEHSISFEDMSEDSVLILISSDPVYVALDVGESKEVDLDGDGVNDVLVTFNGFVGDEADITYEVLTTELVEETEEVVEEEGIIEEDHPHEEGFDETDHSHEEEIEISEEEVESEFSEELIVDDVLEDITSEVVVDFEEDTNEKSFLASFGLAFSNIFGSLGENIQEYRTQLIVLIILLILIILSIKTDFFKGISNFFEEEVEEEPIILKHSEEKKIKIEKPKEKKVVEKEIVEEEVEDISEESKESDEEEESEEDFIIEFDDEEKK